MGITGIKKEIVRAAKWWLVLVLLISACSTIGLVENTIKGNFYLEHGLNNQFTGVAYQFSDSTFTIIRRGDVEGMELIANGFYNINSDTLILNYKPMKKIPKNSTYNIVERKKFSTNTDSFPSKDAIGIVMFQVVDRKGEPLPNAKIFGRNKSQKRVQGYTLNRLGYTPKIPILESKIRDFFIGIVYSDSITIPVDTLSGFNSKVKVLLTGTTYDQYNGTKKYFINKADKNKIILKSLEKNKKLVLKRKR